MFLFIIQGEGKCRIYKANVYLETGKYCSKSGQVEIRLQNFAKDLSEIA